MNFFLASKLSTAFENIWKRVAVGLSIGTILIICGVFFRSQVTFGFAAVVLAMFFLCLGFLVPPKTLRPGYSALIASALLLLALWISCTHGLPGLLKYHLDGTIQL